MAYVYLHTRLDKNEPFYVGKGSDRKGEKYKYRRAFAKKGRNRYWLNIIKLTKYKVEILFDNMTTEEACQKEIELIKFYGRADLGLGPLCNLTDGGEGVYGCKVSPERIEKMRKKIVQKDFNNNIIKTYDSTVHVGQCGFTKSAVIACCKKQLKKHAGFIWQYFDEQNDDLSFNKTPVLKIKKAVIQKDKNGNIIKIWDSITQATKSKENKFTANAINKCCNKVARFHKGFKWEYVDSSWITKEPKKEYRDYKKVVQINQKNNLVIKIWEHANQAQELGFNSSLIGKCCRNKAESYLGFKWVYFNENEKYEFDYDYKLKYVASKKNTKKIKQIDFKTGKLIKIYDSLKEIKKIGFNESALYACLRSSIRQYKGYKWAYAE